MREHIVKFRMFLTEHILLIVTNMLLVTIVFGLRIFSSNITIDSGFFTDKPDSVYNWLDISRWGLVLTKKVFHNMHFNLYAEMGIAFFIILLFLLLFSYFFSYVNESDRHLNYYLFCALFITHPLLMLQWYFYLQAFEIAVSIALVAVSLTGIFTWIKESRLSGLIVGEIAMIWAMGSYQSNVILYIAGALGGFLLLRQKNIKDSLLTSMKLILTFTTGFLVNTAIGKLFSSDSSYLDTGILWGKVPIKECIHNILKHIQEVLLGKTIMNLGFALIVLITLLYVIYNLTRHSSVAAYRSLVLVILIATPFFLTLYMGNIPVYRSQYVLPFIIGFCFMYFSGSLFKKHIRSNLWIASGFIIIGCMFVLQQLQTTLKLWYTEDIRYQQDMAMYQQLSSSLVQTNQYTAGDTVAFVGTWEAPLNPSCSAPIEFVGISHFSLAKDLPPYYYHSNTYAHELRLTNGIELGMPSSEQMEIARREATDMPVYPSSGSIRKIEDGFFVIKIGEDPYPL